MESILNKIDDPELKKIVGCVKKEWSDRLVPEYFQRKASKLKKYDPDLLWMLMYTHDYSVNTLKYLDANYLMFHQILDAGFAKKVVTKGNFQSHVWEMILCDVMSSYGHLIEKDGAGADLWLQTKTEGIIQIEAVVPEESAHSHLQTMKPVFDNKNFFSHSGKIDELEKPIVLRFLAAFDNKANRDYDKNKPLIIAINTGLVVGLSTLDEFVIKQALFGLGCQQITRLSNGSFSNGLQQTPVLDKGGGTFPVGRFRDVQYSHVSGVIYSSQKPHSLTPYGCGWDNSGLVYVPNPLAKYPVNIDFDCMRNIKVTEEKYENTDKTKSFNSVVKITS